ncbi:SRPBCC domain-containing protein [Saccharomonospora sp. NPDC046836]|uniref:SRPBCC family protein n=1 Tax=Saccharomonospora sp. NPDC046836 TaxID=3156921 RepID=UPI0033EADBE2
MTDDRDAHVTHAEVEIAASPEEVWEAITTASGSAAWSFPADIEPREGGAVRLHRGPFGPDAFATVTAWEPPHRFAYEERAATTGPTIATEFLVEARERGSCVVRVVSGLYADGDGWDDIAEETGTGWRMALLLLRSYVTHFADEPAARLDLTVPVRAPATARAEVGTRVAAALGLSGLAKGAPFRTPANAPHANGTVEHLGPFFVLLRATQPCPALFGISSFPMDAVTLSVNVTGRLYGPGAEAVAERERPRWHEWLTRLATDTGR